MNFIKELFGKKRKFGSKQVQDVYLCIFDLADGKYKACSSNSGECIRMFDSEPEMDTWISIQRTRAESVVIAKVVYPLFSSDQQESGKCQKKT